MMARIPYGIPLWGDNPSLVILYASFTAMVWVCGEDLPCGYLHVRQKADVQGTLQVDAV